MKRVFVIFFMFLPLIAFTQIINVESLRKATDTIGWSGNTSLNFSLTKNTNTLIRLNNNIHVQYKHNNHLALFVNNLGFEKSGDQSFVNNGSQHLRYNYKINNLLTWEAFAQSQYNSIAKIKFRGLLGSGFRSKLLGQDKYRLYFGTSAMYEHQELKEEQLSISRNWRSSNYVSMRFHPTENLSFVSTSYYQPLYANFNNYRFATENTMALGIIEKLSLRITYKLIYESKPATEVPKTFYNFTTGLMYSFD